MPLATVTQGPTPPSGRSVTSGELVIRFDEPYADGIQAFVTVYRAEYDTSTGGWKPLGEADGTNFRVPAGADGYPQPPAAWLVERLVLDDASVVTSRRGPMRILETSDGVWAYGTPDPGTLYLTDGIDDGGGGSGDVSEGTTPYFTGVRLNTPSGPLITGSAAEEFLRFTPNPGDGTAALHVTIDAATGVMTIQNGITDSEHAVLTDGDDAAALGSGAAGDGQVLTADGAGGAVWEDATGGGEVTTAALLGVPGVPLVIAYRSANARWEFEDGTPVTFTGRACNFIWKATEAQLPSQGVGDSDFRELDTAHKLDTSL